MSNISSTASTPKRNQLSNFSNAFQNLKIGQKIIVGSIVALALLVIITTIVLFNLNALTADFNFLVEHDQPVLFNAAELEKLVIDMETGQRGFIITGKDEFLEPYNNGQAEFDKLLEAEKVLVSDNPPQVARLEEIGRLHEEWTSLAAEPAIAKRRQVNQGTATIADVSALVEAGTGKKIIDETRAKFTEFTDIELALTQQRSEAAKQVNRNLIILAIGLTVLGAVIVLGSGAFIASRITTSLNSLTQGAQTIIGGDLSTEVAVTSKDETGVLAGTFNAMTAKLRQAFADVDRRASELATVAEVGTATATILQTDRLLQEVVELTKERFNLYHSHIYLLDEEGNLVLASGAGAAGRQMVSEGRSIPLDSERSLVARAARAQKGVTVNDVTQEPDFLANPLLPNTRSELAVPMIVGGKVIGVFDVQSDVVGRFTESDINIQTTLAAQVSGSIQNVRSFENSQKIAADMGVVAAVGIATSTITDIDLLLQEVVDLSKKSFNLYHVHIYLLNEAGDALELTSGAGEVGKQMVSEKRSIALDSEQSLVARAARSRAGVVVNDVTLDANFLPNPLLPDTRAEMAVPMIVAGKVIGVLDVQSETIGRFTDVDVSIKTTLASQVSVALQNARSFSQAQKQAQRETAVNLITQKIQGTTRIEDALQITARELGHALGMRQTRVSLDATALADERKVNS